jgi:hypothetical protein
MSKVEKKELALVISEVLEATVIPAIDGVRDELKNDIASVKSELKKDIEGVRTDLGNQIEQLDRKLLKAIDRSDERFVQNEKRITVLEGQSEAN